MCENEPKCDLSDLGNDLSIKSFSSQFVVTIMGKLHAWIEEKLLNRFWINGQEVSKLANLDLSDLEKWPLERFNQIQLWVVD